MKDKAIEVFTVPKDKLLCYYTLIEGVDPLLFSWEIKEVRLAHGLGISPDDDEIQFTVCPPEVQLDELAESKAKAEKAIQEVLARWRQGEIADAIQATKLAAKARDCFNFKVFTLDIHFKDLYRLICQKNLPSGQKITKIELINDAVEFTMVRA